MADLEEKLRGRGKGGVVLGKSRIYSLAYADDIVLLAECESGMRLMMREFEKYVSGKDLCVNVEKTKVLRFRNRKEGKEEVWKLNGKSVEEVDEFCYLGYWFKSNGSQELHVSRRLEKAGKILGQVCGIGKRRFKDDWRRRMWLFDVLVWSVICYGVEIWEWKERKKVESMSERYMRWTMEVSRSCLGYMLREELGREKMLVRQRRRAWGFEEKLREGRGNQFTQRCREMVVEREERGEKEMSKWEVERGMVVKEARKEGRGWYGLEGNWKEMDKVERWQKILRSRYNIWYKMVKRVGVPKYLDDKGKESKWSRMVRFRMGEGVNACRYWLRNEEKMCRVCGYEVEDWGHVLERCGR
ncbi:uncharacterized protein LOC127284347 [Leptopilina boulardi]|uniref:uncharacterized protein LOC127284347 n=1 Tax=Leptopilina boulardi TaxID=63433 RepID=UPI0021F58C33|nr:uncharacterized protein LOC127284347 [Leptopilina boulardi]